MHFGPARREFAARGRRRLVAIATAGTTLVAGVGMAGLALASPAGAAGSGSGSALSCPAAPAGSTIAFSGSMTNTTVKLGNAATVTGLSGSLCGSLDVGTFTATIPASGFQFSPATTKLLGFLSLPTTTTVTGPATAALTADGSGGFNTSMSVSLMATANLLGLFNCTIGPFTPTFTTGKSGSLTGTPLTGSIVTQLTGTLVAGDFTVPKITPSASCPGFIAGLSDLLIGLPLAAGKSTISATATMAPVLPGSSSSSSSSSGSSSGSGSGSSSGSSGSSSSGGGWGWGWHF